MSYKPDEKDWMAYLYGEVDEEQRLKIEAWLRHQPEAAAELEQLNGVRAMLSRLEDKEVIAPPVFVSAAGPVEPERRQRFWGTQTFRTVVSIAASVLVIIIAGRLTGARLTVSPHELRLSFGAPSADATPPKEQEVAALSPEAVQAMINASLEEHNEVLKETLTETQRSLEASIRSNLAHNSGRINALVKEASSASQDQVRAYVEGMRTENMEQIKDYFQLTSAEQKQYIENLLVDFSKYLQQQRSHDLQLVQTRMNDLEQNTDLLKQETEQILSSIITTVGTPVSEEAKY